jgi:NADH:ubiquinone oxidoreductase subunit 3 (subunit A)
MAEQFLPVLITLTVAVGFAVVLLGFAALVAQRGRHQTEEKGDTYESGVPLLDASIKRISVKFYIVALIFVVLDVEVAFLYPWAVTYRELLDSYSLVVLWDMLAFIALLAIAYIYLWKKGVLDWGRRRLPSGGGGES